MKNICIPFIYFFRFSEFFSGKGRNIKLRSEILNATMQYSICIILTILTVSLSLFSAGCVPIDFSHLDGQKRTIQEPSVGFEAVVTAQGVLEMKWWERAAGGSGIKQVKQGNSVQQTTDGGYIIAGTAIPYGADKDDVYLLKTDASGNKQWEKTYGGNGCAVGNSVQRTTDGGYIITGATHSYGAVKSYVYLIKTDASGNKQWEKTYDGEGSGKSVQQTTDGGYIIAGDRGVWNGVYLIKTDASGDEQWKRIFGRGGLDWGESVQQTTDGGYIIAGTTQPYGAYGAGTTIPHGWDKDDVYLIKTDASGNKQWEKTFGGNSCDQGNSVQQTTDGSYIIAGDTGSYGAKNIDVYLIKLNIHTLSATAKSNTKEMETKTGTPIVVDVIGDCSLKLRCDAKVKTVIEVKIKDFSKVSGTNNPKGIKKGVIIKFKQPEEIGILYVEYLLKPQTGEKSDMWVYMPKSRRIRRISADQRIEKISDCCSFTYDVFLSSIGQLYKQDEINVAGEKITVLERDFKELNPDIFKITELSKW